MSMKKKPGTTFTQRKSDAEELGKAIKRRVINRAKDEESLEEIKEYVYADTPGSDLTKHNLHNTWDDV